MPDRKELGWQISPPGISQRRSFVRMVANGQEVSETEARWKIRREYDSLKDPVARRRVSDKWRDDNDRVTREKEYRRGKEMEQRIKMEYQKGQRAKPVLVKTEREKELEQVIMQQERRIHDLEERLRRLEK